ncbi:heat shock protein Hsp90 [Synechococcus sp. 65AY6Li]|jgi:molecular chaperone HtpG|uniref:molecular chaperone HtpG n=1 Tax=unclassified Synechococcus TaxID=2626047 RepID=UPI000C1A3EB4|nr:MULTISPECIES: molecular chaperone HtpG [unclassified Synechococcus]PIK88641.1 heat shock protein Hsp90 [Synechococcus sp. 65AY6A5]PIK89980.1 heat shock protein Hsp90 [Synechococcus sp. 65AY6Li]PIK94430.1 heat shock protein Hsp90 [Synechococcus sp. 60AY4M2]PIK96688.1 heat shock protein Hsp90 [Synechococcus sp. 63AY4M1]PIL00273.1 heat shock protein Hsp90 [Synechococcus sp. 65AY640]
MTVLEQGSITIHTENIFPIIKQSLYSDREIFLRELISNAADAIAKLKMAKLAGEVADPPEPEITIALNKEAKTLSVSDTGIGMTAEEVKKYINQVAFSSAEEFLQKYKGKDAEQAIIGHFGLGFYSSFMVAQRVEIDTLSYQPGSTPVKWSCDGSPTFTLSDSQRSAIGTTVTLYLSPDSEEYLEPGRIRELVRKYCDFIPVPIKLNGEVINRQKPLWKIPPSELKDEDYLEFYRYLYPFQEDPHFWVHINTDYPFIVQGILYFPKLRPDIDPTKGQVKLYCNQVFVQDNCEEVIPKFLLPLRGAIDSPDIPLNVSRSFLQNDRTVRRIGDHVAKKVADRLNELYKEDYEKYVKVWPDISLFMKFGAMNNDKFFAQIKDILIFRLAGSPADKPEYVTLKEYLERTREKQNKRVYYATDEAAQSAYIDLHRSQGLEVIMLDSWIDSHFSSFLEREYREEGIQFKRVDSELDETLIQKDKAAELVDPVTQKTRSEKLVDLFRQALGKEKLQIKAEALKSESVPAMILLPEALRRLQELNAILQQKPMEFLEEHTLVLNTAHPLIQNLQALAEEGRDPELVNLICNHIYDLALITQKSFDPAAARAFVQRSNEVLTRLTRRQ